MIWIMSWPCHEVIGGCPEKGSNCDEPPYALNCKSRQGLRIMPVRCRLPAVPAGVLRDRRDLAPPHAPITRIATRRRARGETPPDRLHVHPGAGMAPIAGRTGRLIGER